MSNIVCDNTLCIYFSKNGCSLDSIVLDSLGICIDCINIDVDEKYIEQKRRVLLNSISKQNKKAKE